MALTEWATVEEVEQITGVFVPEAQVLQAQAVINVFANRTPDQSDRIGERDLNWLKQALAFQAAWQLTQLDYTSRTSVASLDQDGMKVTFSNNWQAQLAPLAERSLKNLSWLGRRVSPRNSRAYRNFLLESSDAYHGWRSA